MYFLKRVLFMLFLLWPLLSYAQESENITINQIIVKGNDRIQTDAILTQIKTQKGLSYSESSLTESVRADVLRLYQMGYFYNIEVDQTNSTLTYTITEKPFVTTVIFDGNDELSDEDLQEALDIKPYEFLNVSSIQVAIEKLQKLYEEKGFFLAKLGHKLDYLENNTAKLTFQIQENDKVKVKDITILGNKNLSDDQLTSLMLTKEKGLFSFLSGSGQYRQEFFERDAQVLKLIYYNEGYINVQVDLPRVYISPDRKSISIRVSVNEGNRYKIGNVSVNNDELFSAQQLLDEIKIKDREFFAYNVLQSDLSRLQAMYGDLGYAYTNVVPQTRINEEERKVDITFEIEKGNKVSFGRISIIGNEKTRDKVIRREMKIKEGELYHETHKRESIANIRRLGYFEEVDFQQKPRPNQPHIMDIEIHVTERSTDSIQLQVGYNGRDGFMGTVRLQSYNLFGRGQSLALGASTNTTAYSFGSPLAMDYFLQFTEPYFLDSSWSTGIDMYHREFFIFEDGYRERRSGGALRLGHPLAPYLRGFVTYKYYYVGINTENGFDPSVPTFSDVNSAIGHRSIVGLSLQYDRRDDRLFPKNGVFFSSSMEYAGVGGGKKYIEGFFNARFFKEVFWGIVFRNNLVYSFLTAPEGHKVPFNQLFRLGGSETLRGYDWISVGKIEKSAQRDTTGRRIDKVVGGTQQLYYNLEMQFPLVSRIQMLGVLFFDIGYADDQFRLANLRSNVGFGFRLNTPISPIRIEFGIPIKRRAHESGFVVQFGLGSLAPF